MVEDNTSPISGVGGDVLVNGEEEDADDLFLAAQRTNLPPEEPWRDEVQSWGDVFRFLYDIDAQSTTPSSSFVLNKDVSFLVGQEVVYAHSFILQLKSGYFARVLANVFNKALLGEENYRDDEGHHLWELSPLRIPNSLVDPDTFKAVIKFMYVEDIDEVSDEKLVQLADASKIFEIRLLEKKCKLLLESRLNRKNVVAIYNAAERLKNEGLMIKCVDIIIKTGAEFFISPDFVNISHPLLCQLLASSDLNVSEIQIFRSTILWARGQLKKSHIIEHGENLRKVLNQAHRHIRFPLLPSDYIVKEVRPLGILTDTEFSGLACFYLSQNSSEPQHFCSDRRNFQEEVQSSASYQQQSGTITNPIHMSVEPVVPTSTSYVGESTKSALPIQPIRFHTKTSPLGLSQHSNSVDKPQTQPQNSIPINLQYKCTGNDKDRPLDTPTPPNPTAHLIDIFTSSSSSEQEEGEVSVAGTPRPIPRIRISSSDSVTTPNGEEVNQLFQVDRKRKLSTDSHSDSKRSQTTPPEGCDKVKNDKVVTITGTLDKTLTYDDVLKRINTALTNQQVEGLHRVAKITLLNVLLPKRRKTRPTIIVPNIRHIEIVFDSSVSVDSKQDIHPDDYLIFGAEPHVEILLDKGLWQKSTRFSLWENGIRRFEVNPEDHTFFLNVDNQETSADIVKSLVVDLEIDNFIKKLALSSTPVHFKLSPEKLTHLVLHRCSLERTDLFRECMSLEKLSWVGFIEKDTLDLSHLENSTSLTTLSLCNITVKGVAPVLNVLQTLHLVLCRWDQNFEEQLGVMCPSILRLFISAYHNFIPSDTMATSFLTQMKGIENILITYAPPWVSNCARRNDAGQRFFKFLESKVMLTNPNLSQVTIPRNGFRLRRMGRNWNFLHLPTGSSSPLVDKEYFDYFLLQVFARDHISYFRETMLECSHNGCRGRYFHHGNILNLCLHEQEKSNASCCRMAIFNLSQQQSRCTEEFPLEQTLKLERYE